MGTGCELARRKRRCLTGYWWTCEMLLSITRDHRNANKRHSEMPLRTCCNWVTLETGITRCWQGYSHLRFSRTSGRGGACEIAQWLWDHPAVSYKFKYTFRIQPSCSTAGYLPERQDHYAHRKTHIPGFTVAEIGTSLLAFTAWVGKPSRVCLQ